MTPRPRHVAPKYLGTAVARLLMTGDVSAARALAQGRTTWRVPEARAIDGACRHLQRTYGAPVTFNQFL